MCGIYCLLAPSSPDGLCHLQANLVTSKLYKSLILRGPDCSNDLLKPIGVRRIDHSQQFQQLHAFFTGHVLRQRGTLTSQPMEDSDGNVLMWNGEIFAGIKVDLADNDGHLLLTMLQSSQSNQDILTVLSQIKGPWSFIYWQESQHCLWFGRDCLGRRSLLWGCFGDGNQSFALSSVARRPEINTNERWSEVPADGIFCLDVKQWSQHSGLPIQVMLFPWQQDAVSSSGSVFSPTVSDELKEAVSNGDLLSHLEPHNSNFLGQSLNPDLSFDIMTEGVKSPIAPMNMSVPTKTEEELLSLWGEQVKLQLLKNCPREILLKGSACSMEMDDLHHFEGIRIFDVSKSVLPGGSISELLPHKMEHELARNSDKSDSQLGIDSNHRIAQPPSRDQIQENLPSAMTKPSAVTDCARQDVIGEEDALPRQELKLGREPSERIRDCLASISVFECEMMKAVTGLIKILQESVKRRVFNLPRPRRNDNLQDPHLSPSSHDSIFNWHLDVHPVSVTRQGCSPIHSESDSEFKVKRSDSQDAERPHWQCHSRVAILFSGGIDSMVIAAFADRCIPKEESVDLINVAFQQLPKTSGKTSADRENQEESYDVPDRLTGRAGLEELRKLNPERRWNFVEVNVTFEELRKMRGERVSDLIYPLQSVMDDSIGCAIWFAARGQGLLTTETGIAQQPYESPAKVVLVGMGADEQLAGYSRHRTKFKSSGWSGLVCEVNMEVSRIASRNLGRDDRIISDHGREARFPFLDEDVVNYLNHLPIWLKVRQLLIIINVVRCTVNQLPCSD
ncbi:asparagine synthetase domain-containing protein 1-like isoform X2 [Acanthaster planci]|uniref:Asparagine synthetase domain-containing protein 1-like isoform X2 n=1 Tax=Acanthaster planci TaxID=133434 RepID=A0A8B7ZPT2_ACAPL|nr:asparagine synthetase domain-containing protein 1-like isoform X2 [Acanthaster planci]